MGKSRKKQRTHKSVKHVLHNMYFSKPYKPPPEKKALKKSKKVAKKKPGFFGFLKKPQQSKPVQLPKPPQPIQQPKPQPKQLPPTRPDFAPIADKNLEKRLEQLEQYLEKRIAVAEQSIALIKDLFDELKKDNESLRRERAIIFEKLSSSSMGMSEPRHEEISLEETESGKKPTNAFADNSSRSNVNTSLDQLLDMIMEKGSIKISDAAKRLKIKDKQIEEWAKILEEHDLIEIHYPAIGKPVLKKKT